MQAALRPYFTAGVALVGASAIAVTPVAVPRSAVEEIHDRAVELSAFVNPVEVFGQVLQQTFDAARMVGQGIVDNPAPVLEQLIRNQIANFAGLPAAVQAQFAAFPQLRELALQSISNELQNIGTIGGLGTEFLNNVIGAILGTGPGTVEDQIQLAINAVTENGDFAQAFGALALIPVAIIGGGNGLPNLFTLIPELSVALQQPFTDLARVLPIAAGPLTNAGNVAAALPTALLSVGANPLLGLVTLPIGLGTTLNGVIEAVQTNNPEVAFNAIVEQSSQALGTLLNSVVGSGGVIDGLQNFREAIATALGAPPAGAAISSVSSLPTTATKSATLTTPLVKPLTRPLIQAAPKASTPTTADKSSTTTGTDAKNTTDGSTSTRGGNLFTPGSSSSKGGKHRAETGNLAQGLRDTIKSITGLGHSGKSDKESSSTSASKDSGSSSGSSGSAGSGSNGGSSN